MGVTIGVGVSVAVVRSVGDDAAVGMEVEVGTGVDPGAGAEELVGEGVAVGDGVDVSVGTGLGFAVAVGIGTASALSPPPPHAAIRRTVSSTSARVDDEEVRGARKNTIERGSLVLTPIRIEAVKGILTEQRGHRYLVRKIHGSPSATQDDPDGREIPEPDCH